LHLKIVVYHDDSLSESAALPLELLELKQVLIPRQWFFNKLDAKGELSVPNLRDLLRQHMLAYRALVLLANVEPGMQSRRHLPSRGTTWQRRRLAEECACNENAIDSKVKYLRAPAPAAPQRELVVPAADGVVMPSSDDDFEV
jgi:hypothetical protein